MLTFAGASDATYHIMWIVLFSAVDDFGIREINDLMRTGSPGHLHPRSGEIEALKQKVMDTALASATRIAGLVSPDHPPLGKPSSLTRISVCLGGHPDLERLPGECAKQQKWKARAHGRVCRGWTRRSCTSASSKRACFSRVSGGRRSRTASKVWSSIATRTKSARSRPRRCAGCSPRR